MLYLCSVCTAIQDGYNSPIIKLSQVKEDADLVIGVSGITNEVWVIPAIDISACKTIRLGKRWNCYKVLDGVIRTEHLEANETDLKVAAQMAAIAEKERQNGQINNERNEI